MKEKNRNISALYCSQFWKLNFSDTESDSEVGKENFQWNSQMASRF